jgi:hypothetical protein
VAEVESPPTPSRHCEVYGALGRPSRLGRGAVCSSGLQASFAWVDPKTMQPNVLSLHVLGVDSEVTPCEVAEMVKLLLEYNLHPRPITGFISGNTS